MKLRHIFSLLFAGSAMLSPVAHADTKVAFVPMLIGIPYFDAMEAGGKRAAKDLGIEFIYQGPVDANPVDQLQIIENLINQEVDAISVAVLDAQSLDPLFAKAKSKGLQLFTSDSDAPDSDRPVFVAQATNEGLGNTIIDELVERVGTTAKIGIVSGAATATNLNTWIEVMQARVAEKYPNVTLLEPQYSDTGQQAAQKATDLMTVNPDLNAIIGVASTTCPGVGQAIENANKVGKVIGTGYCSPNTARSYVKSGAMGFTVLWDPEQLGYLTAWAGMKLVAGEAFAEMNEVPSFDYKVSFDAETGILLLGPPAVFTKENIDDYDF